MLAIDGEEAAPPATDNTRTTSQYAHRRGTSKINAYSYILDGTSNFEQRTECYADTALFGGADEIRLGPTLMRSKPQMECIGVTPRAEAAKDFGCHMLPACDLLPYIDGGAIQCSIFDQSCQTSAESVGAISVVDRSALPRASRSMAGARRKPRRQPAPTIFARLEICVTRSGASTASGGTGRSSRKL